MTTANPKPVEFSKEDSDRLVQLSKEIGKRLEEIAALAAKARGSSLEPGTKLKFVPRGDARQGYFSAGQPVYIEILDLPDGTTCCVVWEQFPGVGKLYCPC